MLMIALILNIILIGLELMVLISIKGKRNIILLANANWRAYVS